MLKNQKGERGVSPQEKWKKRQRNLQGTKGDDKPENMSSLYDPVAVAKKTASVIGVDKKARAAR